MGIKEGKIPLEARIISICDAFDAMTSERVYREKMDLEMAFLEIENNSGKQFDPGMVPVFIEVMKNNIIRNQTFEN